MHVCFLYGSVLKFESNRDDPTFDSDVMMLDLEDSVHISAKEKARNTLKQLKLDSLVAQNKAFGVRINNINTLDGIRDLNVVCQGIQTDTLPIQYLQIPKVSSHYDVLRCRSYLNELSRPIKLFPIVETPEGIADVEKIAKASDLLLFGQADLTATMYQPNAAYLAQARGRFCVACAEARIVPVDTWLFEEITDMVKYELGCIESKKEGFLAKAVIHPNQVPIAKQVFALPQEILTKYQEVINCYEQAEIGFQFQNGAIIAPPFVEKAKLMLGVYQAINPPSTGKAIPVINDALDEHNQ